MAVSRRGLSGDTSPKFQRAFITYMLEDTIEDQSHELLHKARRLAPVRDPMNLYEGTVIGADGKRYPKLTDREPYTGETIMEVGSPRRWTIDGDELDEDGHIMPASISAEIDKAIALDTAIIPLASPKPADTGRPVPAKAPIGHRLRKRFYSDQRWLRYLGRL